MTNKYFGSCRCGIINEDAKHVCVKTECCSVPVMAFVPDQPFAELYEPCDALRAGTLFVQLNKPFDGKGCKRCGCKMQ